MQTCFVLITVVGNHDFDIESLNLVLRMELPEITTFSPMNSKFLNYTTLFDLNIWFISVMKLYEVAGLDYSCLFNEY